jgi:peptide/nickel transport system permease protein
VNIATFLRRRLLQVLPVLFGIVLVVFLVVRLIPGDPARIMLGVMRATEENLAALRTELGLDLPVWQQFVTFVGNVVQGELGTVAVVSPSGARGDLGTAAGDGLAGGPIGDRCRS